MTLKIRNRIIKIFAVFSALCLVGVVTAITVKSFDGTLAKTLGSPLFSLKDFSFFKPNEKAVLYSLIFLQVFIPITDFFMLFSFEKTQSTLIILFIVVLFGFQFEISRFIIGVYDLKRTFSQFYLLLGKYSLLGRLLCLFSFLPECTLRHSFRHWWLPGIRSPPGRVREERYRRQIHLRCWFPDCRLRWGRK